MDLPRSGGVWICPELGVFGSAWSCRFLDLLRAEGFLDLPGVGIFRICLELAGGLFRIWNCLEMEITAKTTLELEVA